MKKFSLLLILIVFITSCSSDDDDGNSGGSIIGTWYIERTDLYSGADDSIIYSYEPEDECEAQNTITFEADGDGYYTNFGTLGDECIDYGNDPLTYSYDPSTSVLIIMENEEGDNYSDQFDVVEVTDNRLVLAYSNMDDEDGDGVMDYARTILVR